MNTQSQSLLSDAREEKEKQSTFQSIFFSNGSARSVRVPDYQRAYSWKPTQINLFIQDLNKHLTVDRTYYFGHFIAEDIQDCWEVVDGQQRLTTFVLFLMVCQHHLPSDTDTGAYSMIQQFSTVSYDREALKTITEKLGTLFEQNKDFNEQKPPSDEQMRACLDPEAKTPGRSRGRFHLPRRKRLSGCPWSRGP